MRDCCLLGDCVYFYHLKRQTICITSYATMKVIRDLTPELKQGLSMLATVQRPCSISCSPSSNFLTPFGYYATIVSVKDQERHNDQPSCCCAGRDHKARPSSSNSNDEQKAISNLSQRTKNQPIPPTNQTLLRSIARISPSASSAIILASTTAASYLSKPRLSSSLSFSLRPLISLSLLFPSTL